MFGWRSPSLDTKDAMDLLHYSVGKCKQHHMGEQAICLNESQTSKAYCTTCFSIQSNHNCKQPKSYSLEKFLNNEKQMIKSVYKAFQNQKQYVHAAHQNAVADIRVRLQRCIEMLKGKEYETKKKEFIKRNKSELEQVAGMINNHIAVSKQGHKKDIVNLKLGFEVLKLWESALQKIKAVHQEQIDSANELKRQIMKEIMQILKIQQKAQTDNVEIKQLTSQYQQHIRILQDDHRKQKLHLQSQYQISQSKSKLRSCIAYSQAIMTILKEGTGDAKRIKDLKYCMNKPVDNTCQCKECETNKQGISALQQQFEKVVDNTSTLLQAVIDNKKGKLQMSQLRQKLEQRISQQSQANYSLEYSNQQLQKRISELQRQVDSLSMIRSSNEQLRNRIDQLEHQLTMPVQPDVHLSTELDRHRKLVKLPSQLLNQQQKIWLIEQIEQILQFSSSVLIFTASHAGFSNQSFHKCCDQFSKLIFVAKTKDGYKFGGYSQEVLGISSENDKSQIFSINNRVMMGLTKDGQATRNLPNYGPLFGYNDISIDGRNAKSNHHTIQASYVKANIEGIPESTILFGKHEEVILEDYEVFKIQ